MAPIETAKDVSAANGTCCSSSPSVSGVSVSLTSACLSVEGLHQRKGAAAADKNTDTFTWQDVAKHNTAKSAWVIIRGVVYDVTGASLRRAKTSLCPCN
jgi:hypothetical protein